jgi:hypothetical protein
MMDVHGERLMKLTFATLAVALLLWIGAIGTVVHSQNVAQSKAVDAQPEQSLYLRAAPAVHAIVQRGIADSSKCSGTAVGPHAILSAAHCDMSVDYLEVDAKMMRIVGPPVLDGLDHVIYIVDGTFPQYAALSEKPVMVGDDFFYFGHPVERWFYLRKGYIVAFEVMPDDGTARFVLDVNGYYGDSGAAVFNKDGEIITVMSYLKTYKEDGDSIKLCYGWQLQFSELQMKRVAQQ